jgi:hypothetical protein
MTDTTIKSRGGLLELGENEIEVARTIYLRAYDAYVEQRTAVNRNEMYKAYEALNQVKARYAEARRLLLTRVSDQQVQQ